MSKKKPRWEWTDGGWEAPTPFTQDDYKKISALLGAQLDTDQLRQLNNATKRYLAESPSRPPNISEVRAALSEVEERAQKLLTCLENLDDYTRDYLFDKNLLFVGASIGLIRTCFLLGRV